MLNTKSDNNKDGELSKVKDFDTSSLGPVKMNKQFVEEFISVMKDQFSSLKHLQTSVASDVKQLVSKVNEASEIATSAKATADANERALNDLKSELTAEI